MTSHFYLLTVLFGAAVTAATTPLAIMIARRFSLMDTPGLRKIHRVPMPRVGGLAIVAGVFSGGILATLWANSQSQIVPPAMLFRLIVIAGAASCVAAMGLIDDMRKIPARYKALMLITAAMAVCGVGVRIDQVLLNDGVYLNLGFMAWPITVLWIATVAIGINFIDGLDGLASGIVAIAAATLAFFCVQGGFAGASIIPLALVGSLTAFLFFNFYPARTFMGDCGSMFIGFIIAVACVLATPQLGTMEGMVVPSLALSIPLLDTAVTLFRRRFIDRRSIFAAERGHIHHRMINLGLSQRKVTLTLWLVSVAAVGIGWMSLLADGWATVAILSLLLPLLLGLFRAVGSVRTHEMINAVRRKHEIDREARRFDSALEELQLAFREVHSFSEWWQRVCDTATRLEMLRVSLPLERRDGAEYEMLWTPAVNTTQDDCERISTLLPIRDRRNGGTVRVALEVATTRSLESAGHRIAVFSRLMADYSLADLPDPAKHQGYVRPANRRRSTFGHLKRIHGWDEIVPPEAGEDHVPMDSMRVAIVHDFLYTYAGAERVLEQLVNLYPDADLFSLFDFLPPESRQFIHNKPVHTSFLQRMPLARTKHRHYLPLMPLAIEQLDVTGYDLVISSSYMAAKGVITGPEQVHVCYCHSPVRYAWDLQHQYLAQSNLGWGPKAIFARLILHYIRNWDVRSSTGVDVFVANSKFVARRIEKVYRRESRVVHPPVATDTFNIAHNGRESYYVTASRLVPYKRMDLIVEAFNRMPDRELIVVGDGPEMSALQAMAGDNVQILGHQPLDQLRHYLQTARAFIFAAEEDFGIVPVEAMACGTPVIAYGHGGVTETVIEGRTGVLFEYQSALAIVEAVRRFELIAETFEPATIRKHALRFTVDQFRSEFLKSITYAMEAAHQIPHSQIDRPKPAMSSDMPTPGVVQV
jgi:UDP-N-acetylmuramyl pentapeptide phosphotransferase/UDP-N-acetylglucosamine-1-phosphate transferase/glycosyltransferase involved in cell wall biosynthesis